MESFGIKLLEGTCAIDKCQTSNGRIIEPLILEYGTWVTIVALTKQQEVLLIKQYRHGAEKILLEVPGDGHWMLRKLAFNPWMKPKR